MPVPSSAQSVKILEKLQSAICNIDRQSTDENILFLNQELAVLRSEWQGQKVPLIYLQIVAGLNQYIATTKGQADPGAFSLMGTVFDSLKDMVVNPTDEEAQTKKVMVHVDAYNQLKNALASDQAAPISDPEVAGTKQEAGPDQDVSSSPAPGAGQAASPPEEDAEMEADPSLVERFVGTEEELVDTVFGDAVAASGAAVPQREDAFELAGVRKRDLPGLDHAVPDQNEDSDLGADLQINLADGGPAEEEVSGLADVEDPHLDVIKVGGVEGSEPAAAGGFADMGSALDDFFAEEEAGAAPAAGTEVPESQRLEVISETAPAAHRDVLREVAGLKALLVSTAGIIDDQLLGRFEANIATLAQGLAGHEVALVHLHFVEEVVRYVARHQDQVLAEAMECLQKVMAGLEELLADNNADRSWSAVRAGAAFMHWHQWLVADLEKRLQAAHGQDNDLVGQHAKSPGAPGAISQPQKLKQEILSEVRQMLALEMQNLRREVSGRD